MTSTTTCGRPATTPARPTTSATRRWAPGSGSSRVLRRAGSRRYAQRVVAAMKTYGLVLADNGSPWFFQGEQNAQWPDRLIEELKQIPASAFVAVDTSSLMVSGDSAQVR